MKIKSILRFDLSNEGDAAEFERIQKAEDLANAMFAIKDFICSEVKQGTQEIKLGTLLDEINSILRTYEINLRKMLID